MKAVIVVAVLALVLQQTTFSQSTTTVDGVVLESKTDRPIDGATVTMIPEGLNPSFSFLANSGIRTGVADSQGHFVIADVTPGRYRVVPERSGYAFAFPPDTKEARDPGIWIQVGASQPVTGIQLKIIRKAVISGRVLDPKGNAAPGTAASVALMRYRYDDAGQRKLAWVPGISYPQAAGSFLRMNDKGEYRFYDLPSGDYYISVSGGPFSVPSSPTVNVPFYYPGTTDENKAEAVHVEAGDEIQLGTMLFHQVNAVAVRFRFTELDGVQPTSRAIYFGAGAYNFPTARKEATIPLAPGHYDMVMSAAGSYARVSLDVGNAEIVQDVVMKRGYQVRARLYWEDDMGQRTAYRPALSEFNCRLRSSSTQAISGCSGRDSDYYFGIGAGMGYGATPSTPPDSYRLELTQLPSGSYVRSVTIGGKDVRSELIRVDGDTDIDIVFSSSKAVIKGIVRDAAGERLPDAIVALVPDGVLRSAGDLYRRVVTDVKGGFEIHGIAPGNYHMFAWPDLPGDAYRNAEFMRKYDESGVPLKIETESQITQDVTAF